MKIEVSRRKFLQGSVALTIFGGSTLSSVNLLADKTPEVRVLLSDVMGITLNHVFGVDEFEINLISKIDLKAYTKSDKENQLRENYMVYYDCLVVGHIKDISFGVNCIKDMKAL